MDFVLWDEIYVDHSETCILLSTILYISSLHISVIKLYEKKSQGTLFLVVVCEVMCELTMLTVLLQEPMKHTETGRIITAQWRTRKELPLSGEGDGKEVERWN